MHDHPNSDPALAEAILGLLIDDHPGVWHVADLHRAMSSSTARDRSTYTTDDAIEALHADGLIHRSGDLILASRAAHGCRALPS